MISPLDDAREYLDRARRYEGRASESTHLRDVLAALIRHGDELERRLITAEKRIAVLEGAERPPSGLTMGAEDDGDDLDADPGPMMGGSR